MRKTAATEPRSPAYISTVKRKICIWIYRVMARDNYVIRWPPLINYYVYLIFLSDSLFHLWKRSSKIPISIQNYFQTFKPKQNEFSSRMTDCSRFNEEVVFVCSVTMVLLLTVNEVLPSRNQTNSATRTTPIALLSVSVNPSQRHT